MAAMSVLPKLILNDFPGRGSAFSVKVTDVPAFEPSVDRSYYECMGINSID